MGSRLLRGVRVTSVFFSLFFSVLANAQRVPSLITQPLNESLVVTLKGSTHPLARPQFDIGVAPPNLAMDRMLLVLKRSPQQDFVLHRLLDDQQDKNTASYHKWLTPDQFGANFGVSDSDLQVVTGWLQSQGFQINRLSRGRSVIEFSGTEAQVEQSLHTQIHRYLVNGEQHWANASDPQIPAALASAVAGVWSLHDFRKKPKIVISKNPIAVPVQGSSPLITAQGQHALMPADYATIYNINPVYNAGVNGQGVTIAVVGRSGINSSDIYQFRNYAGLSGGLLTITDNGPDPGIYDQGDEFEAVLDTTWSGAVAPAATVNFVISASTNTTDGVDLSELDIIDNNLGDVMTESFGSCEGFATPAEAQAVSYLAEQAAAEGITYMVSSGDSGAEGCDRPELNSAQGAPPSVSVLASPPYLVAVGGTVFNENNNNAAYWNTTNNNVTLGSAKSYIPENVWNESCSSCGLWAGGGGASTFFSKPNWQAGVAGIPNDSARDVPDVSLTAAVHDPYLVCFEFQCFYGVGGTSASAPSFAGIMALVVQQYGRQGLANYELYRLAASETLSKCNASNTTGLPASTCIFNDVTKGNNAVPGEAGYGTTSAKYQATTGYDLATGLGSVNVANLFNKWNTINFNATNTTLGPATITAVHGTAVSLNVSVAPSSGTGVPGGDVALQTGLLKTASPEFFSLASGSASPSISDLPGGAYTLTARYGGDSTYAPSTSNGIQVNISPENSVTTMSVSTTAANGALIPFTSGPYGGFVYPRVDVAGASGKGTPTGYVTFYENGSFYSGLTLNSQGNTAWPTGNPWFPVGLHSLTATYSGDQSFNQSTSPPVSFTITKAGTTASLSSSAAGAPQGALVTLSMTVTSPAFAGQSSASFPSGTVTFLNGSTQLGTGYFYSNSLNANGITSTATFTTAYLPVGPNTITAQYSGDSSYSAASALPVTVNIDVDFALSESNLSGVVSKPGGSTSNTLTIAGQSGYNGTVNFSCAGLPARSQCSFAPATVAGNGSTTMTVSTSAPSSASLRSFSWSSFGLVMAGVFLFCSPKRKLRSATMGTLLLLATLGGTSCGGGSSSSGGGTRGTPGTPPGNYSIVVTATTADAVVSHTVSFTLILQ